MSKDDYICWLERQDYEELLKAFAEENKLDLDYWLFDRFQSEEADKGDYLYEMEKERRMEQ